MCFQTVLKVPAHKGKRWFEAYVDKAGQAENGLRNSTLSVGGWIDLDATRIDGGFGTGHIALAYSNGSPEDMLSSLGQFEITRVTVNQ